MHWSNTENDALNIAFVDFIKEKRYPQHHDVLLALSKYKVLKERGINKVKSKIKSIIRNAKKTPLNDINFQF